MLFLDTNSPDTMFRVRARGVAIAPRYPICPPQLSIVLTTERMLFLAYQSTEKSAFNPEANSPTQSVVRHSIIRYTQ